MLFLSRRRIFPTHLHLSRISLYLLLTYATLDTRDISISSVELSYLGHPRHISRNLHTSIHHYAYTTTHTPLHIHHYTYTITHTPLLKPVLSPSCLCPVISSEDSSTLLPFIQHKDSRILRKKNIPGELGR